MTVTDFDPDTPPALDEFRGKDFWGVESVGTKLADAAAVASDEFAAAADAVSAATETYQERWHKAFELTDPKKANAAREREADQAAWPEKIKLDKAKKREARAGKLIEVLLGRLTAALGHQKHYGRQGGGDWNG